LLQITLKVVEHKSILDGSFPKRRKWRLLAQDIIVTVDHCDR